MPYNQGELDQVFRQTLGRAPTQPELNFLVPYINQGFISSDQIGKYLQSLPEAQSSRLNQQQGQFQNLLTQNNQNVLNQAADAANGQFAAQGRQFSTGQGNSILQAGQQLAAAQSPMIANFYGQGQQGLNNLYTSSGQGALQRAYNLQDSQTQWNRELQMYDMQKNDYNNYLNQQRRGQFASGLGSLIGTGAGAAIGAMVPGGGAMGAMIGGRLGSGVGGTAGSLFG